MPGRLPSFLQPLEAAFLQAGLQLRMLQRLHPSAAIAADHMCASAAAEASDVACLVAGQDCMPDSEAARAFDSPLVGGLLRADLTDAATFCLSFGPARLLQVPLSRWVLYASDRCHVSFTCDIHCKLDRDHVMLLGIWPWRRNLHSHAEASGAEDRGRLKASVDRSSMQPIL